MNNQALITFSLDAEQAVLGGLLIDNSKWDDVILLINEQNFYLSEHRIIFAAIKKLLNDNIPADLLTVERQLSADGTLKNIGNIAYLAELINNTPSSTNIMTYAQIVRNDSQTRQLFALGKHICTEAQKTLSKDNLDGLLQNVEQSLTELTFNQVDAQTNANLTDVVDSLINDMENSIHHNSAITGVPFGIDRLDTNTTGAHPGDFIIVAARPSMGKTALSLTFAYAALNARKNQSVHYYSLEMPAKQIMQRMLSMISQVPLQKVRQATSMTEDDWHKYSVALGEVKEWENRFLLDESSYLTPQMLRTRVRRNIRQYGQPSVIIIDYLQLMSEPQHKERNLEISSISRALKQLAKEVNCPVIGLSQLNRNLEQRADKRPLPSDLRDSGSLEQDADVLIFIYRDEVYNTDTPLNSIAELIISKQRNGPVGTVLAKFKGEYSKFENISDEEYNKLMRD
ncbi:replicative DNA helicase [[Pasteurella] aerogenes]